MSPAASLSPAPRNKDAATSEHEDEDEDGLLITNYLATVRPEVGTLGGRAGDPPREQSQRCSCAPSTWAPPQSLLPPARGSQVNTELLTTLPGEVRGRGPALP